VADTENINEEDELDWSPPAPSGATVARAPASALKAKPPGAEGRAANASTGAQAAAGTIERRRPPPPRPRAQQAAPPEHEASSAERASDASPPASEPTQVIDDADGLESARAVDGKAADEPSARLHAATRCSRCGTRYSGHARFCPFDGQPLEVAPSWDPSSDPLVGRLVEERYEVEAVIAEGGMGTVYRIRHVALGSVFAMKVLRRDLADDAEVSARLVDEARATAAIGHPNIVGVTDFGSIDNTVLPELQDLALPYFVMEMVNGESLGEFIRRDGKISPERVITIMTQCAAALGAAHAVGIIHRDLKPDNIRVQRDDAQRETAKVLDFGVAKIIGASRKTRAGMVFGTPHYMSPEQGQGHAIDHRTDIYALGVLMYECLTGKVPFAADTYMGVVTKHMFAKPVSMGEMDPELQGSPLDAIVLRCLEKDPEDRFNSMGELSTVLAELRTDMDSEIPAPLERPPKLKLRHSASEEQRASLLQPASIRARNARWLIVTAVGGAAIGVIIVAIAMGGGKAAPDRSLDSSAAQEAVVEADEPDSAGAETTNVTEAATHPSARQTDDAPGHGASNIVSASAAPTVPAAQPTPVNPVQSPPARTVPPRSRRPPPSKSPRPIGEVVDPWGP